MSKICPRCKVDRDSGGTQTVQHSGYCGKCLHNLARVNNLARANKLATVFLTSFVNAGARENKELMELAEDVLEILKGAIRG